jgi:hypothetical protein
MGLEGLHEKPLSLEVRVPIRKLWEVGMGR